VMRVHDQREAFEQAEGYRVGITHTGANFPGLPSDMELEPTGQEQLLSEAAPRFGNPTTDLNLPGLEGEDTRDHADRLLATEERYPNAHVPGVPDRRDFKVKMKKPKIAVETARQNAPYIPGNKRAPFEAIVKKESRYLKAPMMSRVAIDPIEKARPSITNRPRLAKGMENRERLDRRALLEPSGPNPTQLSQAAWFFPIQEGA
jgi:hypothetical protein